MKMSEYSGWNKVFLFSFSQGIKQPVYIGVLIGLSLLMLIFTPLLTWFSTREEASVENGTCYVSKLIVYDELSVDLDFSKALKDVRFHSVMLETNPAISFDEAVKRLQTKNDTHNREMLLRIYYNENHELTLSFFKPAFSVIGNQDYKFLANTILAYFDQQRVNAVVKNEEQLEILNFPIKGSIEEIGSITEETVERTQQEIVFQLTMYIIFMTLVFLVIGFCCQKIAFSIISEKSGHVVEYLLVSVRPMALVSGKILAMLALVLIQMGTLLISGILSVFISYALAQNTYEINTSTLSGYEKITCDIHGDRTILAILVLLFGLLCFCIFAALTATLISQISEIGEGLKLCNMLLLFGLLIGISDSVLLANDTNRLLYHLFSCLNPVSAPFIVPIGLLTNKVSVSCGILSAVFLMLTTGALFLFTARVYETLIYYNTNTIKLKYLFNMIKRKRLVRT